MNKHEFNHLQYTLCLLHFFILKINLGFHCENFSQSENSAEKKYVCSFFINIKFCQFLLRFFKKNILEFILDE